MAPLSKELAEVILPHDHHGSHFCANGKTIDSELQLRNFEYGGKVLIDLRQKLSIDGHPTVVRYVDPADSELDPAKAR